MTTSPMQRVCVPTPVPRLSLGRRNLKKKQPCRAGEGSGKGRTCRNAFMLCSTDQVPRRELWRLPGHLSIPPNVVLLVLLVVALEPDPLGVALRRQDVCRDAVEEEAVVAHHEDAARKVEQRLLQAAHRVDVKVVGRFVEQQHVAARLEHLGKLHAVALAARQLGERLLLRLAGEAEPRAVRARAHLLRAEGDRVEPGRELLKDGVVALQRLARLVDADHLDALADDELALVRGLLAGQHAHEGRLARAVRPDHADDAARRQGEGEAVDERPLAEALAHALGLDDLLAEARAGRDVDGGRVR
mmetsp:Transcript_50124/g.162001  ORF Transcript_50124/g.162001 Transcript_50124/m.162001 type:complete len:302 (-) Transcript_50124:1304-2209(-)